MSKSAYCGQKILFGGISSGDMVLCGEECRRNQSLTHFAGQIGDDAFNWHVRETHQGACPQCDGPGPVDMHQSYIVYSVLVLTTWMTRIHICCQN